MTGIPCVHACASLVQNEKDPYGYVDHYYSVDAYKKAYEGVIMPIPDQTNWVNSESEPVDPPNIRVAPGRPKKVRRKAPLEDLHCGKLSKVGIPIHCSHCGHTNHNVRSCKNIGCLFQRQRKSMPLQEKDRDNGGMENVDKGVRRAVERVLVSKLQQEWQQELGREPVQLTSNKKVVVQKVVGAGEDLEEGEGVRAHMLVHLVALACGMELECQIAKYSFQMDQR